MYAITLLKIFYKCRIKIEMKMLIRSVLIRETSSNVSQLNLNPNIPVSHVYVQYVSAISDNIQRLITLNNVKQAVTPESGKADLWVTDH